MPSRKGTRFGKPRKPLPCEQSRKCITCGKVLPAGIRYCVSCGTHDEAELDSRVADLEPQLERRRQREFMMRLLSRLTFGLWRF
jgi:hypothetical protein